MAGVSTGRTDGARGIDGVLRRLRAIGAGLPPTDGVAVFNRMYLTVTEGVRTGLGGFADPPAVAALDVLFAGRYLLAVDAVDAVAAGRRPPACWRPLFELRADPEVHPLQFALAGMNAHIQHDLPLAVVDTCRRLGREPEQLEDDYHRINALLAAVETAVREQLMPGPDVLERLEPMTHRIGAWSVGTAREAAWGSVLLLWGLRGRPSAARACATALDGAVGLLGRALLLPLGLRAPAVGPPAAGVPGTPVAGAPTAAVPVAVAPVAGAPVAGLLPVARSGPATDATRTGR
ncbi:DUF5995 family protein [Kitasatospora purpeofusca]|uniref:DUF5995 family protein n=1 Tax=Kitasatospora purpeofusca TaxID=67352 RepID=UPI002A5AC36B|nr:DUF5995 family protein [Kitasatospora purpeofusca]MDY0811301.1 DUF5995 family protein [Kitasatospora purpeofusca]